MAKPNYAFEKRQKELLKKQKKEEKRLRKAGADASQTPEAPVPPAKDEKPAG